MKALKGRHPKSRDVNIKVRADGLLDVDVQLSKPDGRRWRRRSRGIKSKAKARRIRDDFYDEFNAEVLDIVVGPIHLRSDGPTLHEWLEECLSDHWPQRIPQTVRGYRTSVRRHILPYFQNLPMLDLKAKHLMSFVDRLNESRPDLSVATIRAAVGCVKSATTLALEKELIDVHPFRGTKLRWRALERERVMRGQGKKPRRNLLSQDEVEKLLDAADRTIYYPVILLQALLGLRVGEALALERNDFDMGRGTVTIDKQLKRVENGSSGSNLAIVPPKTEAGNRSIPVPERLLDYVRSCDGLICPGKEGGWIDPDNVKNRLGKIAIEVGLAGVSSHSLRHTWISRLLNDHLVQATVVRDLAGHSNISTTLNYYSHSSDSQLRDAMEKL